MEKLKELRELRALTQQDLADVSGVGRATIAALEVGRRKPHPRTRKRLAAALGVSLAELAVGGSFAVRAETEQLLKLDTEEFAALLATLGDGQLIDLQAQLLLLLRYRYGPKVFDTQAEILAYMASAEKERGDRAGELLGLVIEAVSARANERIEARTKALEPA